MANLKEIRTRIASVKTTRQVTSAMKMVSAAKLRKAQEAVIKIRPYDNKLHELFGHLIECLSVIENNLYLADRGNKNVLIVIINSNRGLCGAFNANVNKMALELINKKHPETKQKLFGKTELITIGKNATDFFKRKGFETSAHNDIYNNITFSNVSELAQNLMDSFIEKKYDKIFIIYNQFKNAASQEIICEQFLPVEKFEVKNNDLSLDYIFEPSKEAILQELIPKLLKISFYRAILESYAAEHGARMTSMHKATDNATALLRALNLQYNKARQATITNEILEIVSGAEALKG